MAPVVRSAVRVQGEQLVILAVNVDVVLSSGCAIDMILGGIWSAEGNASMLSLDKKNFAIEVGTVNMDYQLINCEREFFHKNCAEQPVRRN